GPLAHVLAGGALADGEGAGAQRVAGGCPRVPRRSRRRSRAGPTPSVRAEPRDRGVAVPGRMAPAPPVVGVGGGRGRAPARRVSHVERTRRWAPDQPGRE